MTISSTDPLLCMLEEAILSTKKVIDAGNASSYIERYRTFTFKDRSVIGVWVSKEDPCGTRFLVEEMSAIPFLWIPSHSNMIKPFFNVTVTESMKQNRPFCIENTIVPVCLILDANDLKTEEIGEILNIWSLYCEKTYGVDWPSFVLFDVLDLALEALFETSKTIPLHSGMLSGSILKMFLGKELGEALRKYQAKSVIDTINELQGEAIRKMNVDAVTGIMNRRMGEFAWRAIDDKCREEQTSYFFWIADIDNFKRYNDSFGHASGDLVLREVAQVLAGKMEEEKGTLFRYGGEEIAGAVRSTSLFEQDRIGRELVASIRALGLPHAKECPSGIITISVGISMYDPKTNPVDRLTLLRQADKALYAAKSSGKNRFRVHKPNL